MADKAKRYTTEEKAAILKQKWEENLTLEQASEKFKVSKGSLATWMKKNQPVREDYEIHDANDAFKAMVEDKLIEFALKDPKTRERILFLIINPEED